MGGTFPQLGTSFKDPEYPVFEEFHGRNVLPLSVLFILLSETFGVFRTKYIFFGGAIRSISPPATTRGGVLAHATFPTVGNIHFDDEEMWLLGQEAQSKGVELYIVAAHEIGHALGLSHTNVPGALMAPFYVYSTKLELHSDDINGIQFLYGKSLYRRKNFWWFLRKQPIYT
ncbi:hypothetical protein CHS0354_041415 [Potamilus streckersoni]|uniref:Peptidase metallopeptidase domain-containing protein n=1 Tax=Potamilus streckersoni TaxID=2493646 RepID=A0AAE0TAL3_9BIVA|nr:hypothetical protein CHS0354_041415 [Potamilus streckersoni]